MTLRRFEPGPGRRVFLASTSTPLAALSAVTNGAAAVLTAPKAGTIDRVGMLVDAVLGAPPTYRVALETMTTTRQPSGVYLGTGAHVDVNPLALSTGWTWHTLGTPVAVAAGQVFAATVRHQSGGVDASNSIDVAYRFGSAQPTLTSKPFSAVLAGGTWTVHRSYPIMAARYTDGTVVGFPATSVTSESWSVASDPAHLGVLWTPPVRCRLAGAALAVRPAAASDFEVRVYAGSASTPAASAAVDPDVDWASVAAVDVGEVSLPPLILEPGVPVRLVVSPTTANAITSMLRVNTPDADSLAAWAGQLRGTTSPSSIAWTDYDTRCYPIVPLIDQVDAPPGVIIGA